MPPLSRRSFLTQLASAAVAVPVTSALRAADPDGRRTADVCVYAGNAAGIAAAVAAAREGCRVLVIESSRWLGGMTGGGLVHIDWGRSEAAGGSAKKILKDTFKLDKALVVSVADQNAELSIRNLKGMRMLRTEGLNVYDIVKHEWLLITQDAVKAIEARLGGEK